MTAQPLTEAEARILARFDAAPPAPESYACTCGHEGLTAQWHADTCGRAVEPMTANARRLAWFTDDELAAELRRRAFPCPTCTGPVRETVGMVCQTCGTDYSAPMTADEQREARFRPEKHAGQTHVESPPRTREQLAAAMKAHLGIVLDDLVDALLPVVDRIAAERAAAELRGMREALELIDSDGCEHFTGAARCLDPTSGKTRGAQYGADAWCDPCIARAALDPT